MELLHILLVSHTVRLQIFRLYTSSYRKNYGLKNFQGSLADHKLLIHVLMCFKGQIHVCTLHAEALQLALLDIMPKIEHCTALRPCWTSLPPPSLLLSFWQFSWDACCLPCGFLEKIALLQGRICLQIKSQKTNTEMDWCVPWPNGFSVS